MRLPDNYANKLFCKALIKAKKRRKKYEKLVERALRKMKSEYEYSYHNSNNSNSVNCACAINLIKKFQNLLFDKNNLILSTLNGKKSIKLKSTRSSINEYDFTLFNDKNFFQY